MRQFWWRMGSRRYERGTVQSPIAHGSVPGGTVTVYQFDDATGAYAAYSYLTQEWRRTM